MGVVETAFHLRRDRSRWDLEWTLQQQGFDRTYDNRLYDRLRDRHARPVREHFWARLDYQHKMARFLENHDEQRAAAAFLQEVHEVPAVITFLSPGPVVPPRTVVVADEAHSR
jgi:hypothetical protein